MKEAAQYESKSWRDTGRTNGMAETFWSCPAVPHLIKAIDTRFEIARLAIRGENVLFLRIYSFFAYKNQEILQRAYYEHAP